MPKPKPDSIVRHEIILGRREFDALESLMLSQTIENGTDAVENLTKAAGNLLDPLLSMTPTGAIVGLSVLASWATYLAAAAGIKIAEEASGADVYNERFGFFTVMGITSGFATSEAAQEFYQNIGIWSSTLARDLSGMPWGKTYS